jgi:hypothetical protein
VSVSGAAHLRAVDGYGLPRRTTILIDGADVWFRARRHADIGRPVVELRKAQSCTEHLPAAVESRAGDPRIDCDTHESWQLPRLSYNGSQHSSDIGRAIATSAFRPS